MVSPEILRALTELFLNVENVAEVSVLFSSEDLMYGVCKCCGFIGCDNATVANP